MSQVAEGLGCVSSIVEKALAGLVPLAWEDSVLRLQRSLQGSLGEWVAAQLLWHAQGLELDWYLLQQVECAGENAQELSISLVELPQECLEPVLLWAKTCPSVPPFQLTCARRDVSLLQACYLAATTLAVTGPQPCSFFAVGRGLTLLRAATR